MSKTAIINIVGLTKQLIGEHTPFLTEWSTKKKVSTIEPMLPAVTCSVQTTYLTGKWPNEHGIIGNGWFHRNLNEIKFWHQSNALVKSKYLWDELKDKNPEFVCANMFWWFNMYSSADISVTPRPQYRVDGLKIPDCYSEPSSLREKLQKELGQFPLFDFWGPKTSIKSSQWIADASLKVHDWTNPNLMLIYLPHLDYCLQKYGPNSDHICNELRSIDNVCKHLIENLEKKDINVSVISEYGITKTSEPIHINRILRKLGYITVRTENRKELLDPGASKAFAVSDHQIAHIYIKDKNNIQKIKKRLANTPGINKVMDKEEQKEANINHDRGGELVVVSEPNRWFSYYYWFNDKKAPDFAKTVAIHNKPGYDPVELFFNSKKIYILLKVIFKLIKKNLGFRTIMDVIPLNASLVKGSHGQTKCNEYEKPIYIGTKNTKENLKAIDIANIIKKELEQ